MTDDIVTQLRNWHDQRDSWQTLTEAANEIERLRKWVSHLGINLSLCQDSLIRQNRNVKNLSQRLYEALNKNPQEVRGEE